ncbi:MAG: RNA polymerase sigma factor [Alphaproteobacteria bacterium]|nr:RNA polymerase sigma factor [Alphaproteobacteria bacterium]
MHSNSSDAELIEQAIEGNTYAFECLIDRHYMMIFKTAYKWCGTRENAEDISQEVCLKLAHNLHKFGNQSKFTTWVYRVIINTAKDYQKKINNQIKKEQAFAEEEKRKQHELHAMVGDTVHFEKAVSYDIYKEINKLSPKIKDAVILVYAEGFSHKEAGEILGCAEATVSSRVHTAKKKLKKILKGRM